MKNNFKLNLKLLFRDLKKNYLVFRICLKFKGIYCVIWLMFEIVEGLS